MRVSRISEHAALVVLGLVTGLGLDGGLRPWTAPLVALSVVGAIVIGRFRPMPALRWNRLYALLPGVILIVAVATTVNLAEAMSAVMLAALDVGLPFTLARTRRQQIELLGAEQSRTAALLAERSAVAEGARLAERSRLAAEIHHTLGHELALLGVQAGALEVTAQDSAQREAASAIRASAVAATDHLRRALDLLSPSTAVPPADTADAVEDVVGRARRAGLDIELNRDGVRVLPDALALLVEHSVREGIANAARHAAGAQVTVSYTACLSEVVLTVSNGPGDPGEPGTGRGLAHLTEQSRSLGADLYAGPDGEGWALVLRATP